MIGHLGTRISALLDGRLSPLEEERAWAHVHACHPCRDLVEREGWVKTQLAGLADSGCRPDEQFKASLLAATFPERSRASAQDTQWTRHDSFLSRHRGLLVIGSSAAGVAFLGVAALGIVPGTGTPERRAPVTTSILRPAPQVLPGHRLERTGPRRTPSGEPGSHVLVQPAKMTE